MKCLVCKKTLTIDLVVGDSYPAQYEEITELPKDRNQIWFPNGWGMITVDCGYGSIHDQCFGEVLRGQICDECISFAIENQLLEEVDRHQSNT